MKDKILLINDDEFVRDIIANVLQTHGYETIEADGGKTGIDAALKQKPDLVLLDVMMPDLDGYEVCTQLKNNPKTKEIPILFLSSLRESQDKIKGLKMGAVDFIESLTDQGELLARVQTHLKIKALTHELMVSNKELSQKQRVLEEDLKSASFIQQSLLPSSSEKFQGIDFAWAYIPCNPVGGDLFDILQLDEDHVAIYVYDVCGHDVTAAMVTVFISQFIIEQNKSASSKLTPKQMLSVLQKEYPLERFNRFFTIFYAVLNTRTGKLTYSSAGHPPAVVLKPNAPVEVLAEGGIIIGYDPSFEFKEHEIIFNSDDKIILYTDGVTDTQNNKGEFYGNQRFFELLEQQKNQSVETLVKQTISTLDQFGKDSSLRDDVCLLSIALKKK